MTKLIRSIGALVILTTFLVLMSHSFYTGLFHEFLGIAVMVVVVAHVWLSVRKKRRSTKYMFLVSPK